jgi:hypothetical protein
MTIIIFRVISEKKRLESSSGGGGIKIRDIETEELLEDQQQKIRWIQTSMRSYGRNNIYWRDVASYWFTI